MTDHLMTLDNVSVTYRTRKRVGRRKALVRAVAGVSLHIRPDETLALVGESGSGKTTLARAICGLAPYEGRITIEGRDLAALTGRRRPEAARLRQIVFQDPYSSLDPTMTIGDIVTEPLRLAGRQRDERHRRLVELLASVQLPESYALRLPSELSGGQRQRVAIARAIALQPSMVICDEALTALDVTTQREIVGLLARLRASRKLSYLFISHDLSTVRRIADRVAVMYFGRVVEEGPTEQIFRSPSHPYTQALLSAVLVPDPRRQRERQRVLLEGELPDPTWPPTGCSFHPRCPRVFSACASQPPALSHPAPAVTVACHLYDAAHAVSPG